MPSAGSRTLRRLAALALGGALALLGAELGYRALRGTRLGPTTNPAYVVHDDALGWAYRPGARARHASPEFDVAVAIHARGYRGPEWDLAAPGRRLLVLGDSFAFGWGVEAEQALGARAEAALPGWRVLTAAVGGYGTGQELLVLRRLVEPLRPDAVAVVFCENDLFESGSPSAYGKRKPWFELQDGALRLRGQPVPRPWLERWSHLYRAWEKLSWDRAYARRARDPHAEWELVRALLFEMRATLDAAGLDGPLIVLSQTDELEAFAAAHPGVEHVDLRPALAAPGVPVRFAVDGHWTAEGHARVGAALARRVAELAR